MKQIKQPSTTCLARDLPRKTVNDQFRALGALEEYGRATPGDARLDQAIVAQFF